MKMIYGAIIGAIFGAVIMPLIVMSSTFFCPFKNTGASCGNIINTMNYKCIDGIVYEKTRCADFLIIWPSSAGASEIPGLMFVGNGIVYALIGAVIGYILDRFGL